MGDVSRLSGNAPDLDRTPRYAAILGERPSQGARSPLLWNAVFKAEAMDVLFHPLDVTAEGLPRLVDALKSDERFIGGSVAVPHKSGIVPLLDGIEPLAKRIGAVNALYRNDGALIGANTDGAGALASLLDALGKTSLGARKLVQVGIGGAGTAVACYLADNLGPDGELILANRTAAKATALASKLGAGVRAAPFPLEESDMADADIVVNCTSVGFDPNQIEELADGLTPLGPLDDTDANHAAASRMLAATKPDAWVFDIIYQPRRTALLALAANSGRRTLNGLGMNLEQAVLAFTKASPGDTPTSRVREVMAAVS